MLFSECLPAFPAIRCNFVCITCNPTFVIPVEASVCRLLVFNYCQYDLFEMIKP